MIDSKKYERNGWKSMYSDGEYNMAVHYFHKEGLIMRLPEYRILNGDYIELMDFDIVPTIFFFGE